MTSQLVVLRRHHVIVLCQSRRRHPFDRLVSSGVVLGRRRVLVVLVW